jgi:O-glycosyl hydrolase
MKKNGVPIQYLSIANEPDWPHTQPGYFLSSERYAAVFKTVAKYLDTMAGGRAERRLKSHVIISPAVQAAVRP